MAKLADAIHFDYIDELCDEILDRLNNEEETEISVVGTYENIRRFIKEFMIHGEVEFNSLDIDNPEYDNYYDEYIIDIWNNDGKVLLNCEPAKRNDKYINCHGNVLYMLDETKQAFANKSQYDEMYFVIIGEDECDCDECDCACECSKDEDGGYTIRVKCNLDADEAMEIIDKMESRLLEINKIFKEMNNMKNLLGF